MTDLSSITAYNFIVDLNNPDSAIREKSISLLPSIAQILGPERTILELIPYTICSPAFTESELCQALQQISKIDFSEYSEEHFEAIFDSLDPLSKIENPVIVNENAELIKFICSLPFKTDSSKYNSFVPKRISRYLNDRFPSKQVAGIHLASASFPFLSSEKQNSVLSDFLNTAQNAKSLFTQKYVIDACATFIKFTNNQSIFDLVLKYSNSRSPTVAFSIPQFIVSYLSKPDSEYSTVSPIIQSSLKSPNKRLKYNILNSLKDINQAKEIPNDAIFDIFNTAITDIDEEVRIAAASQASLLPINSEKSQEIINSFAYDVHSPHVRTAVIEELSKFSEESPEFVKDTIKSLLKDQVREVRLGVIDSLRNIKLADDSILPSILIDYLDNSNEWREHFEVANLFVFRKMHDIEILRKLLFDDSIKVRLLIVSSLPKMSYFNNDELMPIISDAATDLDYQIRQIAVLSIISKEIYDQKGIEILNCLSKDEVSNVRLVIAKYTPRKISLVEIFKEDPDEDVRDLAILDECSPIQP